MLNIEETTPCTLMSLSFSLSQKWLNVTILWQEESTMSKRKKKKAPVVEDEPEVEVVTKIEYIYEDTKCISSVEPEYQWGEIYRLIMRREVPDIGLEEDPYMPT